MCFSSLEQLFIVDLLSFFHQPDVPILSSISEEMRKAVDKHSSSITFYGLALPSSESIFFTIFTNDVTQLDNRLESKEDMTNCSHGTSLKSKTKYMTWEKLTLMEVAMMMRNERAIEILQRHERTIALEVHPYQSFYGSVSLQLTKDYEEEDIYHSLWQQMDEMHRQYIKKKHPEW